MFLYATLDRKVPMKMFAIANAKADLPKVQCVTFQIRLSLLVQGGLIRRPARTCREEQM